MSAPASAHDQYRAAVDDAVALLHAMVQRRRERHQSEEDGTATENETSAVAAALVSESSRP